LTGNRPALSRGRRFIDEDLNRIWTQDNVARIRGAASRETAEERELAELDEEIRNLMAASNRLYLLDLHSTSGPGPPFVVVEDTLPNRSFALSFPVTLVLGIEEELAGTLSDSLAEQGVTTVGFEAGQHDDPGSVDRAEAAVWIALEASGVLEKGSQEVAAARRRLEDESRSYPRVVEVRDRHPVDPADRFRMKPGFLSLQQVGRGQLLATDRQGDIAACCGGMVLMPLYQEQGEDGFFLVQSVQPVWLEISTTLRRLRLERILHWLPGIRRDPTEPSTFEVNGRIARWFTLEIFHLLGFRRLAQEGRKLKLSRRHHDSRKPLPAAPPPGA
jgi:succinylglutamate desuccinylase